MAADRQRPRTGGALPVLPPVFALVELTIFAAIVFAEYAWAPFPDLTKLNPHPYWLPVLLISLQYGTLSGLLAASIAIIGTVLIGLPEQDIGEAYFNYLIRAWAQPVLWLVVALLLGAFRMRQIEQRDDLLNQVDDLEHQGRLLDEHAGDLQSRCDRLERELVTKARPDPERLLDALARCAGDACSTTDLGAALSAALPDTEASVYVRAGNGLQLVYAHGWPEAAKWPRAISGLDALALTVIGANRAASVLSAGDEKVLSGHGIFAQPIVDETGPIGMLKIERMPPSAIGPDTVARLAVLAAHLPRAITVLAAGVSNGQTPGISLAPATGRFVMIPRLVRRPAASTSISASKPVRTASSDSAG
jgi:polysaccharide biosynthesis protein PelD